MIAKKEYKKQNLTKLNYKHNKKKYRYNSSLSYSSFSTYSQHITQWIITNMKFSFKFLYSFGPNSPNFAEIGLIISEISHFFRAFQ